MKSFDTKVGTQIDFIVLLSIYLDKDYQRDGVRLQNLTASLAENKPLWLKVGQEKDGGGQFSDRLNWVLSDLDLAGVLAKKDPSARERVFVPGDKFKSHFSKLVGELDETMELSIKREENGDVVYADYISGKYKDEKEVKTLVMLTDEQVNHLSRLAREFGYNHA